MGVRGPEWTVRQNMCWGCCWRWVVLINEGEGEHACLHDGKGEQDEDELAKVAPWGEDLRN